MSTLREAALAQQEQVPLSVEALARALVASRVIDAAAIDDPEGYDDGVMLERVRGLHRRLAALAQPEQKPVAKLRRGVTGRCIRKRCECEIEGLGLECVYLEPLYTHPPRREWKGLTEEEKADIMFPLAAAGSYMDCARAIEQALKERNT